MKKKQIPEGRKNERKYEDGSASQIISRLFSVGAWFLISRDVISSLHSLEEATVLCYLINIGEYEKKRGRQRANNWFRCSSRKIKFNLKLTAFQQRRILGLLETENLIKRQMFGTPSKRHFQINFEALAEIIKTESERRKTLFDKLKK
jgi:hypothetical protein